MDLGPLLTLIVFTGALLSLVFFGPVIIMYLKKIFWKPRTEQDIFDFNIVYFLCLMTDYEAWLFAWRLARANFWSGTDRLTIKAWMSRMDNNSRQAIFTKQPNTKGFRY